MISLQSICNSHKNNEKGEIKKQVQVDVCVFIKFYIDEVVFGVGSVQNSNTNNINPKERRNNPVITTDKNRFFGSGGVTYLYYYTL